MNRAIIVVLILAFLTAGAAVLFIQPQTRAPEPSHATLSFSLDFPKVLLPTVVADAIVHVAATGDDARSVTVKSDSPHILVEGQPVDVRSGTSADIKVHVEARDVHDGPYKAQLWLYFSDSAGTHDTEAKEVSFYILPHVSLQDVRWASDFWHPFGKGEIGRTDSTTASFKISSQSKNMVYEGMVATAAFMVSDPGLKIIPTQMSIEPIGPQGRSNDYGFTIDSNNTPPGKYMLLISLFSKDHQLVAEATLELTVTA